LHSLASRCVTTSEQDLRFEEAENRFKPRAWQLADKVNWSEAITLCNVKLVAKKNTGAQNHGFCSVYDKDMMRTVIFMQLQKQKVA
jgi:hypothetical protein